jgi:hypothetical protein
MDDLELELVVVAEVPEFGLATEEIFGVEVKFVVERAFAGHLVVEEFAVHWAPVRLAIILSGLKGKVERTLIAEFAETKRDGGETWSGVTTPPPGFFVRM